MTTPDAWRGEAERLARYTEPFNGGYDPAETPPWVDDPLVLSSAEEAIGYALLETEHIPGFVNRAAAFHDRLLEAGYVVVEE